MSGFATAHKEDQQSLYGLDWLSDEDLNEKDQETDDPLRSPGSSLVFSQTSTPVDPDDGKEDDVLGPMPTSFTSMLNDDGELEDETDKSDEVQQTQPGTHQDPTDPTDISDPDDDSAPTLEDQVDISDDLSLDTGSSGPVSGSDSGLQTGSPSPSSQISEPPSVPEQTSETPVEIQTENPDQTGGSVGGGESELVPVSTVVLPKPAPPETPFFSDIFSLSMGGTADELTQYAQNGLDQVTAVAMTDQAEILARGSGLAGEVTANVTAWVGAIESAYASSIANVRGHFASLRGQVDAAVAEAVGAIDAQLSTTVGLLDATVTTQVGVIDGGFDTAEGNLEQARLDGIAEVEGAWNDKVQSIRDVGKEKADAAMEEARKLARGWTGGEGIEKERNDARRKAALDVGKKFAKEIQDNANTAADSLAGGVEYVPDAVNDVLNPIAEGLGQARIDAKTALQDAADGSKRQAEELAENARTALRESGASVGNSLTDLEEEVVSSLESSRDQVIANFRDVGDNLHAEAVAASENLASTYGYLLAQIQAGLDPESIPRQSDTDAAVNEALNTLAGFKAQQIVAIEEFRAQSAAQLDESGGVAIQAAVDAEAKAISHSNDALSQMLTQYKAEADAQVKVLSDYGKNAKGALEDMAKTSVEGANTAVEKSCEMVDKVRETLMEDLQGSKDNVVAELDEALNKVKSEATTAADKAAAEIKEKSWLEAAWDVVASVASILVSIVVAVVVFVAVAAFIIGTFGGGLVVLIAAGAIAGFAAGILSSFAGDATKALMLWDSSQFKSPMEYLQSGIVGAVGGAFAIPGAALSGIAATLVGIGGIVSTALVDQGTDILLLGQEWSTPEFVGSLVLGGLLMGAGKLVPKSWGQGLLNKLFPPRGNAQNWNGFQSMCRRYGWLKNVSIQNKGKIWTHVVKSQVDGVPGGTLLKFVEEYAKSLAGKGVLLENDRYWVNGIAFDDPDSAEQAAADLRKKQEQEIAEASY